MKILVVEDEYITASFIKSSLLEMGADFVEVTDNSIDAIHLFSIFDFDLVFMDINIKGKTNGIELATNLYLNHQAKIIFLTSYHDSLTIHEASFSNPIGYLIKPITKSDIEAIIMIAKTTLNTNQTMNQVTISDYIFDMNTKTLTHEHKNIKLSKLETEAMYLLVKNINSIVSHDTFYNYLWNEPKSESTLRELIFRLRKKAPKLNIEKCSNVGYSLTKKNERI